ncbi:MAG: hypothetical protein IJI88_01590 [Atopobiaceae bacterium]|nr:hypothetical protein [Atopobiaceae bacterium]
MDIMWDPNSSVRARIDDGVAIIGANREGLLTLAENLVILARERPGAHVHFDQHNSLEDGSCELIIERLE